MPQQVEADTLHEAAALYRVRCPSGDRAALKPLERKLRQLFRFLELAGLIARTTYADSKEALHFSTYSAVLI